MLGGQARTTTQADTGTDLLRFVESLARATSISDLARRFSRSFAPLFDVPMHGLYVVDPWTGRSELVTAANVSEAFLARYERHGREVDVLREHVFATSRPAYTGDLMEIDEWLEHPLYRRVKCMHDMRYEITTPVITRDGIVGTLHFGGNGATQAFTPYQVRFAETVGRTIGAAVERIHHVDRLERESERMRAALAIAGTAVVTTDPASPEPLVNAAARRLLDELAEGEAALHRLLARTVDNGGASRYLEVQLLDGTVGLLCARISSDGTVMVLELQRATRELDERTLAALTPREREVALRVVEGASDREIAEHLFLSPYTVRQHVKRIYRKVDVDSRVTLTRLLLGADPKDRTGT